MIGSKSLLMVVVLLVNRSPCILNFEESRSTLKFADRANSVMTTIQVPYRSAAAHTPSDTPIP